ncbi:HIT domain-containing protein [bacterium]|nr:HIT domain-containing protein [bacterium]
MTRGEVFLLLSVPCFAEVIWYRQPSVAKLRSSPGIWHVRKGDAVATIFTKIIDREIPADIVYEDDHALAFRDINPQAPVHVLIIPKQEIASLNEITAENQAVMAHLFSVVRQVAAQLELTGGYRTVINCGADGGQTVDHIHIHLLGGRELSWPPG